MTICVVGGLPEPIGGVTNFLYRLLTHFKGQVNQVIDLYPATNKWKVKGVNHVVRPRSRVLSVFWLLRKMRQSTAGTIYFNFSSPKSLLLLLFLPKPKGVIWALTLHHGALIESMYKSSILMRKLARLAIKRVDRIGFISENQRSFYEECGVNNARLFRISTYLPYVDCDDSIEGDIYKRLAELNGDFSKLIVASGYPTSLYRHDWVLEYFERLQQPDVGLVLCLYGADNEGLLEGYKKWSSRLPNVTLLEGLSPQQFQQVLNASDVYVRPTLTDSYGVAVAEALECGLVVLASDACERARGAHIFARNNRAQFEAMLDRAIREELLCAKSDVDSGFGSLKSFLSIE